MNKQEIESKLIEYPICEYAFVDISDITFLDHVRYICETECPMYGKSWSCPPAVGTVSECRERCSQFVEGFLFTTIAEVNDIANMEETLATRTEHEAVTKEIHELFKKKCEEVITLSTESCAICESCTYENAPCRFPHKMFPCIESYGILVTEIAEKHDISFLNGANVVTWFSLILYR